MTDNVTFSMIKPEVVRSGKVGEILEKIESAGFVIRGLRMAHLSGELARRFYDVHRERPFFEDLVSYISGGPVVAMVLSASSGVTSFRDFIGATNPQEAREGSIRSVYGTSLEKNAIHGSDSPENARIELQFFFAGTDQFF